MRRALLLGPLLLVAVTAGLLVAACGGDNGDGAGDGEVRASRTARPVDPTLIAATLLPNEIVEVDHYYADAVCKEFVDWAQALSAGQSDGVTPESVGAQREAALADLVSALEAIQVPDAYADVHQTLLGLAREASADDQDSLSNLLGMKLTNDDRQERLQAAANDQASCQRFQEILGLSAFLGRNP